MARPKLPRGLAAKKRKQDRKKEGEMTEKEKREAAETDNQIESWMMSNSIGKELYLEQSRLGMVDTGYSRANWQVAHGRQPPLKVRGQKIRAVSRRLKFVGLHSIRAKIAHVGPYTVYNWIEYVPILDKGGKGGKNPEYAGFIDRAVRRGVELYKRHRPKHLKDQKRDLPRINRIKGSPYG